MPLNNLDFLSFFWTLDGLERSGRPVGIISTYFRQKRSGGFRAMTKNLRSARLLTPRLHGNGTPSPKTTPIFWVCFGDRFPTHFPTRLWFACVRILIFCCSSSSRLLRTEMCSQRRPEPSALSTQEQGARGRNLGRAFWGARFWKFQDDMRRGRLLSDSIKHQTWGHYRRLIPVEGSRRIT